MEKQRNVLGKQLASLDEFLMAVLRIACKKIILIGYCAKENWEIEPNW